MFMSNNPIIIKSVSKITSFGAYLDDALRALFEYFYPMHTDLADESELRSAFQLSSRWDIGLPFVAAALPACAFHLLGWVTQRFNQPGVHPTLGMIAMMTFLQTIGIVGMAIVVLMKLDYGSRQLTRHTQRSPEIWRKAMFYVAISFLLLFDVLTNVAAAFAGAEFLWLLAIPAFAAYLFAYRATFAWL
jgi:hypothetical protein